MPKNFIQKIDCLRLYIEDLESGKKFYAEKLGLPILWETKQEVGFVLGDGVGELVIQNKDKNNETDLSVENVEKAVKIWKEAGGKIIQEPFDIAIGKCAIVEDFAGNQLVLLDSTKGLYNQKKQENIENKRNTNIPASYLILEKEDKILLLRRFNTGYEDGNYSLVAGHAEENETFTKCIIREAKEEAGIYLTEKDVKVVHCLHRFSGFGKAEEDQRIDMFFYAKYSEKFGEIINKEPNKCDELQFFDKNNLPQNIVPYVKHVLEQIDKNNFYSEFGW